MFGLREAQSYENENSFGPEIVGCQTTAKDQTTARSGTMANFIILLICRNFVAQILPTVSDQACLFC